jgi:ribosomal-protein-alanine N-acetyltransferase
LIFNISPARLNDLNAIREIEKVVFKEDAWPVIDLLAILVFPGGIQLKAESAGKLIGFIAVENNLFEKTSLISTVGVMPDYRNQGVGHALLTSAEKRITRPSVQLCVRVSNMGAIHLYEKLGYSKKEIRRKYYSDGEDANVMMKSLGATTVALLNP